MRRSAFAILALVAFLFTFMPGPAEARLKGDNFDPRASRALQGYKVDFGFADEATMTAARTAACGRAGVACDTPDEGMMFWDNTADNLYVFDGSSWTIFAPGAGAGLSLDDAYDNGAAVTVDAGPIILTDASNGITFQVVRGAAATGVAIDIDNQGSGNDITAENWSVTQAGVASFADLSLGDLIPMSFGAVPDLVMSWDTSLSPNAFEVAGAVASTPIVLGGSTTTGPDIKLYSTLAESLLDWDASDQELTITDSILTVDTGSVLNIGDTPFAMSYAGGVLSIDGEANEIVAFGANAAGQIVTMYSATGGSYCKFDSSAEIFSCNLVPIRAMDSTPVQFGTGADTYLAFDGADMVCEGAGMEMVFGKTTNLDVRLEGAAADVLWDRSASALHVGNAAVLGFGETASLPGIRATWDTGADELYITATTATDDINFGLEDGTLTPDVQFNGTSGNYLLWGGLLDKLITEDVDIQVADDDSLIMGFGAAGSGDMTLSYATATDILTLDQVVADTGEVNVGVDDVGIKMTWFGEETGDIMRWINDLGPSDQAALQFTGGPDIQGDSDFSVVVGAAHLQPQNGTRISGTGATLSINAIGATAGDKVVVGDVVDTDFELTGGLAWNQGDADLKAADGVQVIFGDGAASAGDISLTGGATGLLIDGVAAGTGAVIVGGAVDTDWTFTTAAGTVAVDHGANTLTLDGVDLSLADDDKIFFGDTPEFVLDYDEDDTNYLFLDTLGAADGVFQMGTDAANHEVSLLMGNTTKGVLVSPARDPGNAIQYLGTAIPTERVYLPASMFTDKDTNPGTEGYIAPTAGVLYAAETDQSMQTTWLPPEWMDVTADITVTLLWSTASTACDVVWDLGYIQINPETTLATAADTRTLTVTDSAGGSANMIYKTGAMTILAADGIGGAFKVTDAYPLRLTVARNVDPSDDCGGAALFIGAYLTFDRKYAN